MNHDSWREELERAFTGWPDAEARAARWDELPARLHVGEEVEGVVVTRAHFGAWLDLGVGIPALLEIIRIEGLTPAMYARGEWYVPGSRVAVKVGGWSRAHDEIRVYQV